MFEQSDTTKDTNNTDNQLDATKKIYGQFQSAQHVSGDEFAHLQEP
jgi:hypothetical protein